MSTPIDRNKAEFYGQSQPPAAPLPPSSLPWGDFPPRDGGEHWRFQRRAELVQMSLPLLQMLLHEDQAVLTAREDWREDPEAHRRGADRRLAERAVQIAEALQEAADRARLRP